MLFDWIISLVVVFAIIWTLLPMFRHDAWWIRAFEFPRLQVTVLSGAVLVAFVAIAGWRDPEDKLLMSALALCIIFQLFRIARYTPMFPKQLKWVGERQAENILRVLISNVLTPNRNAEALLALIKEHDPDVVLAVETDAWWESKLDQLEPDYPHTVKHPLDNLYGMHLYSRLRLEQAQVKFLVEDDVPSMHAEVVLRSGQKVELHCLHPAPPSPTENETSAERDAELLMVAKSLDADAHPVVVMGDMNDVAWSASTRLFQKISKLLDPRIGRGMYSTFHAKYPFLRWPLDHVFCSSHFTLVKLARLGKIGSDHFPILAELQYSPEKKSEQQEPEADLADEARAEEKIDKVPADKEALK